MNTLIMKVFHASLFDQGPFTNINCRKFTYVKRTKPQNLNVSRLGLQLSLCNMLKPNFKWKTKM